MMSTKTMLVAHRALISTLVAAGCGYAMLRHSKAMLFHGVGLRDGGGWTALVMTEFVAAFGSISIALY